MKIIVSVMGSFISILAVVIPFLVTVSNLIAPVTNPTNIVTATASSSGHARAAISSNTAIPNAIGTTINSVNMIMSTMSRSTSTTSCPRCCIC